MVEIGFVALQFVVTANAGFANRERKDDVVAPMTSYLLPSYTQIKSVKTRRVD